MRKLIDEKVDWLGYVHAYTDEWKDNDCWCLLLIIDDSRLMRKSINEKVDWWESQLMRKLMRKLTVDGYWWLLMTIDDSLMLKIVDFRFWSCTYRWMERQC